MLQPLTSHVVGRGAAPAPLPDAAPAAAAPEPTEFDVDAILGQRGFYFSERTLPLDLGQLGRVDLDQIYQDVDVEQLQVHLEALTFANLDSPESRALLRRIDADLRSNSPLGCRLYSAPPDGLVDDVMGMPLGECSNGGVWYSINHTVIAAAAEHDPALAWDEFLRSTLAQHARCFPHQWVGVWSGPDSYNCDWSDRPGWTWDCPGVGMYCSRHPIQNVHAHAQPLLSFLRIAGVTCDADGLVIRPHFPDGTGSSWSFHQNSHLGLSVSYAPDCVSHVLTSQR